MWVIPAFLDPSVAEPGCFSRILVLIRPESRISDLGYRIPEKRVVTYLIVGKFRVLQAEAVRGGPAVHDSLTYNTNTNMSFIIFILRDGAKIMKTQDFVSI
jgi:hypothetical protein